MCHRTFPLAPLTLTKLKPMRISNRTTKKDLEIRVAEICRMTGKKFVLSGAYGGWQLAEMLPSGSSRNITPGFVPKRQMEDRLNAILSGLTISFHTNYPT